MWTAEPKLEDRKRMGLGTMIFLVLLTGMFIAVKRQVWADVH
jgi:cytochrome c1